MNEVLALKINFLSYSPDLIDVFFYLELRATSLEILNLDDKLIVGGIRVRLERYILDLLKFCGRIEVFSVFPEGLCYETHLLTIHLFF